LRGTTGIAGYGGNVRRSPPVVNNQRTLALEKTAKFRFLCEFRKPSTEQNVGF